MSVFRRRPPEGVRALAPGERCLAWGLTADGSAAVATAEALHLDGRQLAWTQVERVSWQPPRLVLTTVDEREGAGERITLDLAQDHRLAEVVRARVTSSVGWSDVRRLQPSGKVRLVGRRVPGSDDLLWQVVWLEGDPTDPALLAQVEEHLAALRASLG